MMISSCPADRFGIAASTWVTVPSQPAEMEFISFITSMMHTVVSGLTRFPTSTKGLAPGSGLR